MVAVVLGILFEKQNVAFLVGLTFGIAASVNFPVLVLSIYWKGLTTRGALIGGIVGLVSAVTFVVLSKAVWVVVLGNAAPIFPSASAISKNTISVIGSPERASSYVPASIGTLTMCFAVR